MVVPLVLWPTCNRHTAAPALLRTPHSHYRKRVITALPNLVHLDDAPVTDKDRRLAAAFLGVRGAGGGALGAVRYRGTRGWEVWGQQGGEGVQDAAGAEGLQWVR